MLLIWVFTIGLPNRWGFPGGVSGKEPTCQCRRHKRCRFNPWVGKIPWSTQMATCSSIHAWKIPWTEELGGLQSTRLRKSRTRLIERYRVGSVRFSCSVMSNSLQPHELQHARPPYPSPIPRVEPNSRPSSRWCHPAISSSVVSFSSCPQSLSASGYFKVSQLFASGGQSIGVSASTSVLPINTQDW